MAKTVNSYRFLDGIAKRAMQQWARCDPPQHIPWTPLVRRMAQCTVSIVSSAAVALKSDRPFDQEVERRDPWFSDPSYRVIPRTTVTEDIRVCHTHINRSFAERDLNCVMPIDRLNELEALREIARSSTSHYSYMGYTLRPESLLRDSLASIIDRLREEQVDVVVLVPV
jgi:D-proline reductase (dithiol) PrdB